MEEENDKASVEVPSNKQGIYRKQVRGSLKETNFEVRTSSVRLKANKDSGTIVVKNLYLSCEPYNLHLIKNFTQLVSVSTTTFPAKITQIMMPTASYELA